MAKIKLNPVLEGIQGKFGDMVFRRQGDRVIVAHRPDVSKRTVSDQQKAQQDRFRLAILYGKAAMADTAKHIQYAGGAPAKHMTPFHLAVADFLNAPVVDEIDLSAYSGQAAEKINIRAHDDYKFTGVAVAIHDTDGHILEQGAAALNQDGVWAYTTTTVLPAGHNVSIEVSATDYAGHKTTRTEARA